MITAWLIYFYFLCTLLLILLTCFELLFIFFIFDSDDIAEQARLARLPYQADEGDKLPVPKVAKVALLFCLLVRFASICFHTIIMNSLLGVHKFTVVVQYWILSNSCIICSK